MKRSEERKRRCVPCVDGTNERSKEGRGPAGCQGNLDETSHRALHDPTRVEKELRDEVNGEVDGERVDKSL